MDRIEKGKILDDLKSTLSPDKSIEKIIIFGSFMKAENPHDIDVALISSSRENYLTIVMRYKKMLRPLSKKISIDIVPLTDKSDKESFFYKEIISGRVIYEKRD